MTSRHCSKSALQHDIGAGVRTCVRACAIEIKPGMLRLRTSLMYACGCTYGLPYEMMTFIATNSVPFSKRPKGKVGYGNAGALYLFVFHEREFDHKFIYQPHYKSMILGLLLIWHAQSLGRKFCTDRMRAGHIDTHNTQSAI